MAGSGGGSPQLPEVKSTSQLAGEAAQANIANLPALIEAYKKYGPEAASAMLTAAQTMNPTLKPLGDLLNKRIDEVSTGGIPATLRASYEQSFRNAQAARGFGDSPASSNAEAIGLAGLGETYAQNTITGANDYQRGLPQAPGLAELGLKNPTILEQEGVAQEQNISEINRAQQQQAQDAAHKTKKASGIGAALGGLAGGAVGLAGGPFGAIAGAQVGSQIGGTFF